MSKPEGKNQEEPVIRKVECLRCEHSWWPKSPERPVCCPNCQSPRWDRPRKEKTNNGDEPEEE